MVAESLTNNLTVASCDSQLARLHFPESPLGGKRISNCHRLDDFGGSPSQPNPVCEFVVRELVSSKTGLTL